MAQRKKKAAKKKAAKKTPEPKRLAVDVFVSPPGARTFSLLGTYTPEVALGVLDVLNHLGHNARIGD